MDKPENPDFTDEEIEAALSMVNRANAPDCYAIMICAARRMVALRPDHPLAEPVAAMVDAINGVKARAMASFQFVEPPEGEKPN